MSKQSDLAKGTFSGDLTVDTNTLFVDSANNRVGVGTASPSSALHVAGASSQIRNAASSGSSWFIGSNVDSYILHNISATPMIFTTSGTERMKIDSAGRVTMPYQPAFMSAGVGATVTLSNGGEVICSTVVFNRGSHYNNTTGRFTAPISGIYMFTYVAFNPDGGNKQFAPKLNGSDFGFGDTFGIFDTGPTFPNQVKGLSILINLSANDSMSFGFRNGYSGTVYLGHSYFGGYLIG